MNSTQPYDDDDQDVTRRVYSVYFTGRGSTVPDGQFLEALTDEDALVLAASMKPWTTREIWDRHRLVQVLRPTIQNI